MPSVEASADRLIGCGFKIGTLIQDYSERQQGEEVLESPQCVLFVLKKSPCHSQVMIPSVKLDFSHVQSKCGSLDKIQYTASGGNVSDSAEKHTYIRINVVSFEYTTASGHKCVCELCLWSISIFINCLLCLTVSFSSSIIFFNICLRPNIQSLCTV